MKRLILLAGLLGLCLSPTYAQVEISQADAEFYFDDAVQRVEQYGQYLSLIGEPYTNAEERHIYIRSLIREVIAEGDVSFFNDLDPTQKTPKSLPIETYLENIRMFYPDSNGVSLRLRDVRVIPKVFYNRGMERMFLKVVASREIDGIYYDGNKPIPHQQMRDLDFYLELKHDGSALSIYGMATHEKNEADFEEVRVAREVASILDDQKREALERARQEAQQEIEWLRAQMKMLRDQLQLAEEREALHRREKEVAQREAAQRAWEVKRAKEREAEALQEAESERTVREMAQEEVVRQREQIRNQQRKIRQANSSQNQAQRNARESKRVAAEMKRVAEKNRVHLQLGMGAGIFSGANYHGTSNTEEWTISTLTGQAMLGYRLGSLRRGSPMRKTTLNLFAQAGIITPEALTGIFSASPNPLALMPSQSGWFYEAEAGLTLWQRLRLSGGVGWSDLSYYSASKGEAIRELTPYYIGTVGVNIPAIHGIFHYGVNLSGIFRDYTTLQTGQMTLHPRLEGYLRIQLE